MLIEGLVVCVNYADLLAKSLNRWCDALDSIVVVTTPDDVETRELALAADGEHQAWRQRARVLTHVTDAFTAHGADFNKGAAMQEAISLAMPWSQWVLLFDGDIVPPADLRDRLEAADLEPGNLYGGVRHLGGTGDADRDPLAFPTVEGRGQRIPGCFQLFHVADPAVADRDHLLETHWRHAGNYDSTFMARWPSDRQIVLPDVHYLHLGEPGLNWHGRCDEAEGRRRKAARDASRRAHGFAPEQIDREGP